MENKHAHKLKKLAEDIHQKNERIENQAAQGMHKIKRGRRNVDRHLKQIDEGSKLVGEAVYKRQILHTPVPDMLRRIAKELENEP